MEFIKLKEIVSNEAAGYGKDIGSNPIEIPVAKVSNVSADGFFYKTFEIRSFTEKEKKKLLAKEGDLFVVKSSGSKANILSGKTALYMEKGSGLIASNFILRLSPNKKSVNPKYLWYYLNSKNTKAFIKSIVGATTYPNLKWSLYGELKIPNFSLDTQKCIVSTLDDAATLRDKTKQLLKEYDLLAQSIFLDMFVNNMYSKSWSITTIADICAKKKGSSRTGPFGSNLLHSEFVDKGISVLGIDNVVTNSFQWVKRRFITEEKYQKLKRYKVFPGDVLISIMGTVGRVAIVPSNIGNAINTKHLAALTVDKEMVNPLFIGYNLRCNPFIIEQIKRKSKGAIMDGLNLTIIKSLKFLHPPIVLQNQFAEKIALIEQQKDLARQELKEAEDLFNCLLQKAFKGELI